jgi:chorismate mutase
MHYKKINIIRKKLDLLDNKLLDTIKKRSVLVNQILSEKKFKNQIIDKKRIDKILKRIKKKSIDKDIDTKVTNKIWLSMIRAFIDYEFRNFKNK